MNLSPTLRRSFITVAGGIHYLAAIYLTGLSFRPTSIAQFFGHALIYAGGIAVCSIAFFCIDRPSSRRKESELTAEALKLRQANKDKPASDAAHSRAVHA